MEKKRVGWRRWHSRLVSERWRTRRSCWRSRSIALQQYFDSVILRVALTSALTAGQKVVDRMHEGQ
jgi:hypothetical protein